MFLKELKKTWKRSEIFIAFFIALLLLEFSKKGDLVCQMDEEWKVRINNEYEEYLNDENKLRDEMDYYQPDFLVLHDAWYYTDFNSIAEDYVKSYKAGMAQRDPLYDIDRISETYRKIEEQSDQFIFGSNIARVVMVRSLSMFSKCILMFLVFLLLQESKIQAWMPFFPPVATEEESWAT